MERVLLGKKVILEVWQSRGNLFVILLFWRAVKRTEPWNIKGRFSGIEASPAAKSEEKRMFSQAKGFAGKRFLFSPPHPPSTFFFYRFRSNFRAITRLETLATQARRVKFVTPDVLANDPRLFCSERSVKSSGPLLNMDVELLRWQC